MTIHLCYGRNTNALKYLDCPNVDKDLFEIFWNGGAIVVWGTVGQKEYSYRFDADDIYSLTIE